MRFYLILASLLLATSVAADPDKAQNSYVEIRILNPDSKLISSSTDQETIKFVLDAMKRAGFAGSNTYHLSLTCYLQLVSPIPKEPKAGESPKPVSNSRWYLDIHSGHFALEQPPKLAIYKFTKADFATLRKKLQLNEVASLSWETKHAAPVQVVGGDAQQLLPAFRLGISTLPESAIVKLALSQPALLGLTRAQATTLAPLVAKRYELMAASPDYSNIPSLLPYCYSSTRPTKGAALMHIPANANAKSPAIVFLHGYGGSFLWYLHWLAEALPDHIIIAPAYGISPAYPSFAYLAESVEAASKRLGFEIQKPTLIGLSAGAFGACRAFVKNPDRYARLICLAGFPPEDVLQKFGHAQQVHFIAGAREPFVTSGKLRTTLQTVRASCPSATMTLIPDADHFFMLSRPEETIKALKAANL